MQSVTRLDERWLYLVICLFHNLLGLWIQLVIFIPKLPKICVGIGVSLTHGQDWGNVRACFDSLLTKVAQKRSRIREVNSVNSESSISILVTY